MPSTGLLVILAIIPAVVLIAFIYHKDKAEKEPLGLLVGLFFLGASTTIGAALVEVGLEEMLQQVTTAGTVGYNFVMCFFIVALAEEFFKFLVLRTRTWKHRAFNYTFDAIVYSVVISLGFATLENILYITDIGTLHVAVMRGLLSVPGHAINAVFMGLFFGRAKYCECCGDLHGKSTNMFMSLLIPILTHGFYDFCLFSESTIDGIIILFYVYEVIITITAIVIVNKSSKTDTALPGMGVPFYSFTSYPYNYYAQPQYQSYQQDQYQYQQPQYQSYQQDQYQYQQPQYQSYPQGNYSQQQYGQSYNGYNNYNNHPNDQ